MRWLTPDTLALVCVRRREGNSMRAIAREIGVSHSTLVRWLASLYREQLMSDTETADMLRDLIVTEVTGMSLNKGGASMLTPAQRRKVEHIAGVTLGLKADIERRKRAWA